MEKKKENRRLDELKKQSSTLIYIVICVLIFMLVTFMTYSFTGKGTYSKNAVSGKCVRHVYYYLFSDINSVYQFANESRFGANGAQTYGSPVSTTLPASIPRTANITRQFTQISVGPTGDWNYNKFYRVWNDIFSSGEYEIIDSAASTDDVKVHYFMHYHWVDRDGVHVPEKDITTVNISALAAGTIIPSGNNTVNGSVDGSGNLNVIVNRGYRYNDLFKDTSGSYDTSLSNLQFVPFTVHDYGTNADVDGMFLAPMLATLEYEMCEDTYEATIHYREKDTERELADDFYREGLEDGASDRVTSPTIDGCTLVNSSQSTVTYTIESDDFEETVYYDCTKEYKLDYVYTCPTTSNQKTLFHDDCTVPNGEDSCSLDITDKKPNNCDGYEFVKWVDEPDECSGDGYTAGDTIILVSDRIVYACFKKTTTKKYILTYDENYPGGNSEWDSNDCTVETGKTSCNVTIIDDVPTRSGYTFREWNSDKDNCSGTKYSAADIKTLTKNEIVYACWDPVDTFTRTVNNEFCNIKTNSKVYVTKCQEAGVTDAKCESSKGQVAWSDLRDVSECNPPKEDVINPDTGSFGIVMAWIIGFGAIMYSCYYFGKVRENNN